MKWTLTPTTSPWHSQAPKASTGFQSTKEDSRSERNAKGIASEREEEVQLNPSEDCTGQCSATTSRFYHNFVPAPMAIPRSV